MKNNILWIIFDSCRFDTFAAAKTPNISRIGQLEKRYAFASWTFPAHAVYLTGASPHKNPAGVFASEIYKKDFKRWSERLAIPDVSFQSFIPELSLPAFLRRQGYRTNALVSMPVLNQTTIINNHFDRYQLMEDFNHFDAILDELVFHDNTPSFYFINVGETHYPYALHGEAYDDRSILFGDHGVFRHSDDLGGDEVGGEGEDMTAAEKYFHVDRLQELKQKQVRNVEHLDGLFTKLYDLIPPNTWIIVTADHGELFGEGGLFGHGPVFHRKVFEIPYLEGKAPA